MMVLAEGGWLDRLVQEVRNPWQAVLAVGQLVFFSRFLVQWIATERRKQVVMPVAFWWLSLAGAGVTLLALVNLDPPSAPLILAQLVGIVLYLRNLVIHRRSAGTAANA